MYIRIMARTSGRLRPRRARGARAVRTRLPRRLPGKVDEVLSSHTAISAVEVDQPASEQKHKNRKDVNIEITKITNERIQTIVFEVDGPEGRRGGGRSGRGHAERPSREGGALIHYTML